MRRLIYLDLSSDAKVTVNGVLWHGERRLFVNGDVIQVRQQVQELMSLPLHYFADRFTGLLLLGLCCRGPATHLWPALPPGHQRSLFARHFGAFFRANEPVFDLSLTSGRIILLLQGLGVVRTSLRTGIPPSRDQVQNFFDSYIRPFVGRGHVEDLGFFWNEECVFVIRQSNTFNTFWIQLAAEYLDWWCLDREQDLSLVPTWDEHVVFPVANRGGLGLAIRRPIAEAVSAAEPD